MKLKNIEKVIMMTKPKFECTESNKLGEKMVIKYEGLNEFDLEFWQEEILQLMARFKKRGENN